MVWQVFVAEKQRAGNQTHVTLINRGLTNRAILETVDTTSSGSFLCFSATKPNGKLPHLFR